MYTLFDQWFGSLTNAESAEVAVSMRGSSVPPWLANSVETHGIVTVVSVHGETSEVLLTAAFEDYLDTLRTIVTHDTQRTTVSY